jgi:anti-anti-sigma factor
MEKFEIKGNALVASGELGSSDFAAFERCWRDCLAQTRGELLVDFSQVGYMTSAYLGALLELIQSLAERGRGMKLKASPVVDHLLQLTGLNDAIRMVE